MRGPVTAVKAFALTLVPALYERIDIFWEPRIAPGLYMKIAARFNFNGRYSGGSQIVALRFDLQELLSKKRR